MADGPVRPILVVVSEPSLHLFGRVCKRQEPVRVQALASEAAVECLDEGIVGRLAGPGEVQRHPLRIGPQIEVTGDELRALVDPDRPWITHLGANPFQGCVHVLGPIAETRIDHRLEAREGVDDRQHADLAACGELVVNEIHGSDIVRPGGRRPVLPQLRLYPTLRRLVAQLKA